MCEALPQSLPDAIAAAQRDFVDDDDCARMDYQRHFRRFLARHMTQAYRLGYAAGEAVREEKGDG